MNKNIILAAIGLVGMIGGGILFTYGYGEFCSEFKIN